MDAPLITYVYEIVYDLLIILAAGFVAGIVCKRAGFSMLVGYLLAGAVLGKNVLGIESANGGALGHSAQAGAIEHLAQAGALLLLFAVGLEFTVAEIVRMSRYFLIGGATQMLLAAIPVALVCRATGMTWQASVLISWAVALSSTVLVFKALSEWGQTATYHGRRAVGILLFQDLAFVPLVLLVPVLTGAGESEEGFRFLWLAVMSLCLVVVVAVAHVVMRRWIVPWLAPMRSVELVVLFAVVVLVGVCVGVTAMGLPAMFGAFAAGLILSGNRLTDQIDALVLPYRESFAAVFFVSLGTLLDPRVLWNEPVATLLVLVGVLAVKTSAAAVALRVIGVSWRGAAGMGLGLAQLGEFSFLLLIEGLNHGLLTSLDYSRVLFIAMGTLVVTPQLLKLGLNWSAATGPVAHPLKAREFMAPGMRHAVVVGLGPIGRQVSSRLETSGVDVCVVDLSAVNTYPFAQQGFRTVSGDARDLEVLRNAAVEHCGLGIVTVPHDRSALEIVNAFRQLNTSAHLIVRCRYQSSISGLLKAGATSVISEEAQASEALHRLLEGK